MQSSALDNPFWSSLQSRHRGLARCAGGAARYPPAYAPFLGMADRDAADSGAIGPTVKTADVLAALIETGETVYLLGHAPDVPDGWRLKPYRPLAQMVCTSSLTVIDGPEAIELTDAHRADVLALTALVYPHYFRERTMELGRYFGIYEDGRLAAIVGERLGTDTHQEISAVCTHPDFNGRGYARRLLALLSNDNLRRERTPFLHVSHDNERAEALYARMGYRHRRDIGFWSLRRA